MLSPRPNSGAFRGRCIWCGTLRKVWPQGVLVCEHCDNVFPCCYDMHFQGREAGVVQYLTQEGWHDAAWGNISDIVPYRSN